MRKTLLLSLFLIFSFQLVRANEPLDLDDWKDNFYKKGVKEIVQSDSLMSDLDSKPFILFILAQNWFVVYPSGKGSYNLVYQFNNETIKEKVVNDPDNILDWAFNEMPYNTYIPHYINALDGKYTPINMELVLVNDQHKIQNDFIAPPQDHIKKRKLRKKVSKLYEFLYYFHPNSPLKGDY